VHASGHPRTEEIVELLGWVRPSVVIPVHGEPLHMAEHAAVARRVGVGQVLMCRDGELIRLAPGAAEKIDELPAGRYYKDGALLVSAEERTVADRRRLAFSGVASIAVALSERGDLVGDPEVKLTGIPSTDARGRSTSSVVFDAAMQAFASLSRSQRRDPELVGEVMRRAMRESLSEAWNKKPICHVHVLEL
jgi:ribonuclease J